jgi:hypothetical protein
MIFYNYIIKRADVKPEVMALDGLTLTVKTSMTSNLACFPVRGTPINGPRWVLRNVLWVITFCALTLT